MRGRGDDPTRRRAAALRDEQGRGKERDAAGRRGTRDEKAAEGRSSSSPRRRRDARPSQAYVLAGGTWVPGKAVDQSKESHFLAARVVVDTDEDEAFIELHDFPRTAVLEFVVRLRAESRLVRLSGDRDKRSHFYELEKAAGPDVRAAERKSLSFRDADIPRGDESRRRGGCDVANPRRCVAATPRPRRGYSAETNRG